jgi:hypothetical protein
LAQRAEAQLDRGNNVVDADSVWRKFSMPEREGAAIGNASARPVFVVGSPRSGTTMLGTFLGSSPAGIYIGEFAGFYLTKVIVPHEYRRVDSVLKDKYIKNLQEHAVSFLAKEIEQIGAAFFVESTPWNFLVADYLAELFPSALFVLTIRHYSGVIQSLERSYRDGWEWAGKTLAQRAQVWTDFYARASVLPPDRTIAISYDRVCEAPQLTLRKLIEQLRAFDLPSDNYDWGVLAKSMATTSARPTIADVGPLGDVRLLGRDAFNRERWSTRHQNAVLSKVAKVDQLLKSLYADAYSPPAGWRW